jgi:hypothetical protein
MVGPWSLEWGPAFSGSKTTPPPGGSDIIFEGVGWQYDVSPPVFVLCDLAGKPIVELPMVSWSIGHPLSAAGDGDMSIDTTVNPDLTRYLQPWEQTVIMLADGLPVWGGVVVKRRTRLGDTVTQVGVREWSAWLGRVWTTAGTQYLSPGALDDAGVVIHDRFVKAATLAEGYDREPPFKDMPLNSATGVTYDGDFEDQELETNPKTFLQDVALVVQTAGVDWRTDWDTDRATYTPSLTTFRRDSGREAREVVVGADCATATLEMDTDQQATRLKLVGESDDIEVGTSTAYVPLWRAVSYDKVLDVAPLAAMLLSLVEHPTLTVNDIQAPGSRNDFSPGDLMRIIVPAGFDARYPTGVVTEMRVTGVSWVGSVKGHSTKYTLSALWETLTNTPNGKAQPTVDTGQPVGPDLPRPDFITGLREMAQRISELELRRN